jgi:NADP-dependent 3-hydroxy acid dehydrogenase YdfG
MRLEPSDMVAFAAASRDHNPLHLDTDFAHHTPYGRPTVPGALLVAMALGQLPGERLSGITRLRAGFHRPVFPGTEFHLADRGTHLTLMCEGSRAVTIDVGSDCPPAEFGGETFTEDYQPNTAALRALVNRIGTGNIPDFLLAWLAWCSWVVGKRAGGALTRLTLAADSAAGPGSHVQIHRPGVITGTYAGVEARLHCAPYPVIPPVTTASISRYLPPTGTLEGKNVMVVGGSRGFGAALAGAFASQAAIVWLVYRHSTAQADRLVAEFGPTQIRPIQCDATDLTSLSKALQPVRETGCLAGLVLAATPPLRALGMHPDAVPAQLDFIHTSLAMSVNPLAVTGKMLADSGGWLVLASASAVGSPPAGWTHYAAAKTAIETYATDFSKKRAVPTLILRAPKMRTTLADGPCGRQEAKPTEQVAASVVKWVLTNTLPRPGKVDIISSLDQLVSAP